MIRKQLEGVLVVDLFELRVLLSLRDDDPNFILLHGEMDTA